MHTKKLLLVITFVLVGISTASARMITTTGTKPSVGNGNSGSPYEIRTAEELRWFVHYENTRHWFPDDHAKLMADIDLSSICGPDKGSWIPLGHSEESGAVGYWKGKLFGNGHTISGLYVDGDDLYFSHAGFCGEVAGVTITDLTLKGQMVNTKGNAGSLIGQVSDGSITISNCVSFVDITSKPTYYFGNVGGLIGHIGDSSGNIVRCSYQGNIDCNVALIGSLIARHYGKTTVKECSGYGRGRWGLICSSNTKNTITGCISDKYILYEYTIQFFYSNNKEWATLRDNIYVDKEYELINSTIMPDTEGGIAVTASDMANGAACYRMNEKLGGRCFTQNIGTDPVPVAGSSHATVYKVKEYSNCKDFVYTYSNSPEDITTNRNHEFIDGHATCSNCSAPNPSSHAHDGDYYTLATKADVLWFWNMANEQGITELKVRLTADIDMAGEQLAPIKVFKGEIDGAGHTLSGLNISASITSDAGLVGCLKDGGYIHDLVISGTVSAKNVQNIGAFAGRVLNDGTLRNLRSDCRVFLSGETMGARIGGIAGLLAGTAERCINNGAVADMSQKYSYATMYIAGVVGFAESTAKMNMLVNNALVGASSTSLFFSYANINCKAIANYQSLSQAATGMYYVTGISNPGYNYFGSSTGNSGETAITQIVVGSGELCYLLNNNGATEVFGQTLGTDFVPYPGISDAHKRVYNKKRYINCTDTYYGYSNSNEDETSGSHVYNTDGYCTKCYHANISQANSIYQIATAADWNCYAKALNAANTAGAAGRFASAALTQDITLDALGYTAVINLLGNIYGQGHTVTLGNASGSNYYLVTTVASSATVSHLRAAISGTSSAIAKTNKGTITACSATGGMIYDENLGLVSDCLSDQAYNNTSNGYLLRCVRYNSSSGNYDLSSMTGETTVLSEVYSQAQAASGELAYRISHLDSSQPCVWGQTLGNDAAPKLCYGQTKTSSTFVTSVTSYSAEHPTGVAEYYNAGANIDASAGCFMVCNDTEPWTSKPAYNFIVDNGDGTYTAEHINIDPTVQNYLPMEVQAAKFSYSKTYSADAVASLVFPVDMPVTNINGTLYLFDGYDNSSTLMFTSMLNGMERVPANTPMLVKATGGSILKADLTNVVVEPMTEAGYVEQDYNRHLASYKQESVPTSRTVEDQLYVEYYVMNAAGTKAVRATAEGETSASQFLAYFRIPCLSSTVSPAELDILLSDTRSLKTASGMELDLFSLPYGKVTDGVWSKVAHLTNAENIFYGNDINQDNYADLTAYDFIYITGKPNQTYYFYFNGSDATEVVLDGDGEGFVNIPSGECHLRGIRLTDGQTISKNACAKVYKLFLDDKYNYTGVALSGYGELPTEHSDYTIYDATGVKCGITLSLSNPNAVVVGGPNVQGVTNRIVQTEDVMQGFTAESLSITDGHDFCYDFSVLCPNVTYTRDSISAEDQYATAVLPFAVNATEGVYKYVDCDGNKVYFKTPDDTIPAYTPIVINVEELNEITLSGANLQALLPNGTFNLTDAPSSTNSMKYGFVTKRQTSVSVTDNAEVSDYNVYGYSTTSHQFVRTTNTFSISPFRAFFLLPKSTQARANGSAAPASAPSALTIVINGKEIGDANGIESLTTKTKTKTKTYNLLGQPVGSDYKGIVIRNGKKVIIK